MLNFADRLQFILAGRATLTPAFGGTPTAEAYCEEFGLLSSTKDDPGPISRLSRTTIFLQQHFQVNHHFFSLFFI